MFYCHFLIIFFFLDQCKNFGASQKIFETKIINEELLNH